MPECLQKETFILGLLIATILWCINDLIWQICRREKNKNEED